MAEPTPKSALATLLVSEQTRRLLGSDTDLVDDPVGVPFGRLVVKDERTLRSITEHLVDAGVAVGAGDVVALSVLLEAFEGLAIHYARQVAPAAFAETNRVVGDELGDAERDRALLQVLAALPSVDLERGTVTSGDFLEGRGLDMPNRERAMMGLCLLAAHNENRATRRFSPLLRGLDLTSEPVSTLLQVVRRVLDGQPRLAQTRQTLTEALTAPAQAAPESLYEQLEYIHGHWADFLPAVQWERLLRAQDRLREEMPRLPPGPGPPPVELPSFGAGPGPPDEIAFSVDTDWMPDLVLMAKNAFVWLDQLSKRFGREVARLDQIPDEALDELAEWGFTGLWLIGLWERSRSSQAIKRRMGNPDALASAYSLSAYDIAESLGGWQALRGLKARASQRGIRLAADMVPNHTGLDSRWMIDHPDWFIQLDHPPYPNYRFEGPDLSSHSDVGLFLENGYWDHSDAAVVFKRVDKRTGEVRYPYHGNDGTHMPWNDTAQLDFRKEEVRRAVIEAIVHVAREFSIIRFDAAMTLTRQHFQRLWFPEPGTGGAIPSRAAQGMKRTDFEAAIPREFWREVVDEVTERAPDTLLLAEAFWLTESYFVRTLGMHRVYNSAFMNMLKAERNAEYRAYCREIIEYDPRVLGRYVNFMSNPDEETALAQFGDGDKYIGAATLMVTLPGLPMFGHGQIEGFSEKYGMEFERAFWEEAPNTALIARHQREVFPLIKRRRLFSDASQFVLYDFEQIDGGIDENVFVYSNRAGDDRVLVLYNNHLHGTAGRVRGLVEGLALQVDGDPKVAFVDPRTGEELSLDVERLSTEGLRIVLTGYECVVLWTLS